MEVLYRKYRPRRFGEVVGQKGVVETLRRAVEQGKVAHAYIFSGPRGTGKTSVARILAKALNCPNVSSGEPCGECEVCRNIENSNFLDVIEIDAASNRGIDEIRKIRDQVSYVPVQGKVKVYIVDEFHMLTREAFNALLKTLEEPPPNVVFVLATTNLERVPATILSRCQIFSFKNLSEKEIVERLKTICINEGFEADEEAVKLLSKLAKGSLRDAISLLEQSVAYSGKKLNEQNIREALGLVAEEVVDGYIDALLRGSSDRIIEIAEMLEVSGNNFEAFLENVLERSLERYRKSLNVDFLEIGKFSWDLYRQIRYANEKRVLLEAESLLYCQKVSAKKRSQEREKTPVISKDRVKIPEAVQTPEIEKTSLNVEESGVSEEKPELLDKVLEYLRREGDMSLYVIFNMEKVVVDDGKIQIKVSKDRPFNHEILRRRLDELILTFAKFSDGPVDVVLETDEESRTAEAKREAGVDDAQLEGLSDEERELAEKLLRLFPGRVKIEKTDGR